ncbi:hypothetical protein QE152_g36818 [Popillia japonica]|uniref:Uncharacterized protein n=1 Tax=Popillia japonica TaxID=7064 RepID=A0AAW1ICR3_POPJA
MNCGRLESNYYYTQSSCKLSERLDQMSQEKKTLREENRRIAMQMELNPHDQNSRDVPNYCDICGKAKSYEEKRKV